MDACRSLAKGTKPLADAASVSHVLVMMIVHLARKIMYGFDLPLKVGIYIVSFAICYFDVVNSTCFAENHAGHYHKALYEMSCVTILAPKIDYGTLKLITF